MIRTLKEVQKGWIFYLITLGLALLVALFGPMSIPMGTGRLAECC